MPDPERGVGGRPPVRLVGRFVAEFLIGAAADAKRSFDGDLTQALLLTTIAHANVAHLTYDASVARAFPPDGAPPDEDRRPVSVLAVAAATRLPYATAHRHIKRLIAGGLCVRMGGRGVVVPVSVLRRPALQAAQDSVHQKFVDMVAAMGRQGLVLPLAGDTTEPPNPQAVRRIEIDFLLSLFEITLARVDWDAVQLILLAGVMALNIRDVTYDPELSWLYAYADTPPPPEHYRPVSVRRLSEEAATPYETARQCVSRLLDQGAVKRISGGLIVNAEWNNNADQHEMRQLVMSRFIRAMSALARIGVDFKNPPAG